MSNAVITSYTLVDFPTESDMTAFFVFVEQNYEQLANDLRNHGMINSTSHACSTRKVNSSRQLAGI